MKIHNPFEKNLIIEYGVLMSIEDLAEVLKRSKNGLRITLQQDNEVSRRFNPTKMKIGRRVYFDSEKVGQALSSADKGSKGNSV